MGQAALKEVVMQGSVLRLRPKLMTVATNVIGFLPLLWAKGAGRLKAREAGEYL